MSSAQANTVQTMIATTASEPARVVMDGQDVTAQKITDLIEAHKFFKGQSVAANPFAAMKSRRGVPGGMTP